MNIGFIGLGIMGGAAVNAFMEAGHSVTGYDPNKQAVYRLVSAGMKEATSLAALEGAEIILISVPGPPEVNAVVEELAESIGSGSLVADISSVDPATSRTASKLLESRGIAYLNAPVLGRPNSVGSWVLPVGGTAKAFKLAKPALDVIASRVVLVGPSGAGSAIKLLNNMMVGTLIATISEAFALAPRVGVKPDVLYDVVTGSKAPTNNLLFQVKGKKILDGDYSPSFKLDLLAKDNDLCLRMAREVGLPLFVAQSVDGLNKLAQRRGLGELDNCVLHQFLSDSYGASSDEELK